MARPEVYPPWQRGENSDVADKGLVFTEPEIDDLADFHGDPMDPKLSLFVGGNYFFAMAPLVRKFEELHPEFKGKIYWETIPPGLLIKQIQSGGTITSGNMTWTVKADAYFAGFNKVKQLISDGLLAAPAAPYATNTLTIMVPKGNPAHVAGLVDLGKPEVKLVMPNPAFEGVAHQIKASLTKAGGDALAKAVYEDKVANGTDHIDAYPPPPDAALSHAGPRRRRRHMAVRSDLSGRGRSSDLARRHPRPAKHHRDLCGRRCRRRAPSRRRQAVDRFHPLA